MPPNCSLACRRTCIGLPGNQRSLLPDSLRTCAAPWHPGTWGLAAGPGCLGGPACRPLPPRPLLPPAAAPPPLLAPAQSQAAAGVWVRRRPPASLRRWAGQRPGLAALQLAAGAPLPALLPVAGRPPPAAVPARPLNPNTAPARALTGCGRWTDCGGAQGLLPRLAGGSRGAEEAEGSADKAAAPAPPPPRRRPARAARCAAAHSRGWTHPPLAHPCKLARRGYNFISKHTV